MYKDRKYLSIVIPVLCIVTVIFVGLSFINNNSNKELSKEKAHLSSQLKQTTEATTEVSTNNNKSTEKYKKRINKLEKDIEEINDYAQEKGLLEKIAKRIIDLLTFEFPTEDKSSNIKTELKELMTDNCYSKFIKNVEIDDSVSSAYQKGIVLYSDLDTHTPKAIVRTSYKDNNNISELRYFDLAFEFKDKNNGYIVKDINIVSL